MRSIDADALIEESADYRCGNYGVRREAIEEMCKYINAAPTLDVAPVVHGRYNAAGECTICGYPMPTDDKLDAIFPSEIKYCYNCGAKMDGGDGNATD